MSRPPEETPGGSRIFRHDQPRPLEMTSGDEQLIDEVSNHIEAHIGPVDSVFHEVISPYVHIDVHHVAPSPAHPFHTLVTSGMSERPMTTPPQDEASRFAELVICLPPEWPVFQAAFDDPRHYWPVGWLKRLGRFPHEYGTWLGYGHSIPNGDPPEPLADGVGFAGLLLLPPRSLPEAFHVLKTQSGKDVCFWSLAPLFPGEIALKLRKGTEAICQAFDRHGINDVVAPGRPDVSTRRLWWRFGR